MKELKLALIGFGNAGQAFAKMLLEKEEEVRKKYKYENHSRRDYDKDERKSDRRVGDRSGQGSQKCAKQRKI